MKEEIKKFKRKNRRKRKMDNSFTYGVKLKMDLAFNNTNMKIAIVGNKVPDYETFKELISPLLPKIPF